MNLLVISNKGKLSDKSIEIMNEFYKKGNKVFIYRKHEIQIKRNRLYSFDKLLDNEKIDFLYINGYNFPIELIKYIENQGGVSIVSSKNYCYFMKHEQYLKFRNSSYNNIYPKTYLMKFENQKKLIEEVKTKNFGFPIVIKTSIGGNGDGVFIAKNELELKDFTKKIKKDYLKNNKNILVQEFVGPGRGIDYRVTVVNQKIIGVMKRENKNSMKSNLAKGGSFKMLKIIPKKIKETILKINELFPDLIYYGADLIPHENGFKICEINIVCNFGRGRVNLAPYIYEKMISIYKQKQISIGSEETHHT